MSALAKISSIFFGVDNTRILCALILLVSLDYLTGICVAVREKRLSSKVGAKGIVGKVMIFILVALSNIADSYFLPSGNTLEPITILFYCVNESISIVENASRLGIPLPEKLLDFLDNFKGKNE